MYILGNAIKGILRNKKRYIFIAIIALIIITVITVFITIYITTKKIMSNYSQHFGATVYFTPNLNKIIEMLPDEYGNIHIPKINSEQLISFSESSYLKSTLFTASIQVYGKSIITLDQGRESTNSFNSFTPNNSDIAHQKKLTPNCIVIGYSELSLIRDFNMGLRKIIEGNIFKSEGDCIISKELAQLNSIQIGDNINLVNINNKAQTLTLYVSGIYLDRTIAQPNGSTWAVTNRRNEILVHFNTLQPNKYNDIYLETVFLLKSPEYADMLKKELLEKGLPDTYNINIDADMYNKIVKPVKNLKKVVIISFSIIMFFAMIILTISSFLLIQERRYEIAMLRTIGMEKWKIIINFLLELKIVFSCCLAISLFASLIIVQPIYNVMLEKQIKIAEKPFLSPIINHENEVVSNEMYCEISYLSLYDFHPAISPFAILLIIVTTMILELSSTSISIIYIIIKQEPMKLLTEKDL